VHALTEIRWSACPSAHLSRLRQATALAGRARAGVEQVAAELHLPHLAKFFDRVAVKPRDILARVSTMTLKELAERLACRLEGDGTLEIRRVAGLDRR
jgi:hypothetical protein